MKKLVGVICSIVLLLVCFTGMFTALAASDKMISSVSVTGVVDATVGNSPNSDSISVPSNANYTIESKWWTNVTQSTSNFAKFEDAHKYRLTVIIKPKDGYRFDNSPELTVNGKEAIGKYHVLFGEQMQLELTYSFLKEIDKIELPAFPTEVPLGENYIRSDGNRTPTIDTEKYSVYEYWLYSQTSGGNVYQGEFDGVFEDGILYGYEYHIGVHSGYEITDNTVITVGGKEISGIYNHVDDSGASIYKIYNLSDKKAIHTVNITVAKPTVGASVDNTCEIDIDSVTVKEFVWEDSANSKLVKTEELGNQKLSYTPSTGTYSQDRYYCAKGFLQAKSGYYFAEDLVVKINDVQVESFDYYSYGMFNKGSPMEYFVFESFFGKAVKATESNLLTSSELYQEPVSGELQSSSSASSEEGSYDTVLDQSSPGATTIETNVSNELQSSSSASSEEGSYDTVLDQSSSETTTIEINATGVEKGKGSPLPIIILVVAVALVSGCVAAYFVYFRKKLMK